MSVLTWRVLDKHSYQARHFRPTPRNSRLNHGRDEEGRGERWEESRGGSFLHVRFDHTERWTVLTRKLPTATLTDAQTLFIYPQMCRDFSKLQTAVTTALRPVLSF